MDVKLTGVAEADLRALDSDRLAGALAGIRAITPETTRDDAQIKLTEVDTDARVRVLQDNGPLVLYRLDGGDGGASAPTVVVLRVIRRDELPDFRGKRWPVANLPAKSARVGRELLMGLSQAVR